MGRAHRNFTDADRYHVINRGIDGQDLFSTGDDWMLFESLLGRACLEFGFTLNAYALMSNHYHVLADLSDCDDRRSISDAFGMLQSTYARYFNERTKRRGPLFDPRFLSFGVVGEEQFHRVVRYIHRNPIDLCGPRALAGFRWSSLPVVLGRREPPVWLDCNLHMPNDPLAHLAELTRCRVDELLPLHEQPPQRRTSLDVLRRAVAGVPLTGTDTGLRRAMTCLLALELRVADVVAVAGSLGCTTESVRSSASRARTLRRRDPTFDRLVAQVLDELAATDPRNPHEV